MGSSVVFSGFGPPSLIFLSIVILLLISFSVQEGNREEKGLFHSVFKIKSQAKEVLERCPKRPGVH